MSGQFLPIELRQYAKKRSLKITEYLGIGSDGIVWKSNQHSALKHFYVSDRYQDELSCYQHLANESVRQVCGLVVPRLYGSDDELRVLEMELVSPPCLIDFGKAYVHEYAAEFDDFSAEFSPETLRAHEEMQREIWGNHYDAAQLVIWQLKQHGIVYRDPRPANIMFADWNYGD